MMYQQSSFINNTALYCLMCSILFLSFSCDEQATSPENDIYQGTIEIALDIADAPSEVTGLSGILSNSDGDEIYFDFTIENNSANALVENIPAGNWLLQVDAFNVDDKVIYTGKAEITVRAEIVTHVSLHLNPAGGSLLITVTWGNRIITIPDANLLQALIDHGVDKDGDRSISHAEALATKTLNIPHRRISDLTGLEDFVNLEHLDCSYNEYSRIDVSKMKNLVYLDCSESKLLSLDVTQNPKLQHLDCSDFRIPELDLSNNPELIHLNCHNNLIKELDLINNPKLEFLHTQENQLSYLNLSNNTRLTEISLHSIPTLYDVCVWTWPFPPSGVNIDFSGSPNINFTTSCLQDDQFEENDVLSEAASLIEFTYYNDLYISTSDDDWYEMGISADSLSIKCNFNHADGDINIELVDENGNVLATSGSKTDNERINHIVDDLSTYYIRVYQVSGASNTYTIWWDDIWQGEDGNRGAGIE